VDTDRDSIRKVVQEISRYYRMNNKDSIPQDDSNTEPQGDG